MPVTVTATPMPNQAPAPCVLVTVDGLAAAVTEITLWRTAEGRTFAVRGAVRVSVAGSFSTLDLEAGAYVDSSYRVQMFASGVDQGYTTAVVAQLQFDDCWVHNPLDPMNATVIDIADSSGRALTRSTPGERFYPEGRTLGVLVTSGNRRGLEGVDLVFSTDDDEVAQRFESMLGDYDDTDFVLPIIVIRTPPFADFPRTFYASMLAPTRRPITVHMGGSLREWSAQADETAPPFPGLVVALLTRADMDAFYGTRAAFDAAYSSRLAADRDYSKAGTAG